MTTPAQPRTPISGALKNENISVDGHYNAMVEPEITEIASLKANVSFLNKKIAELEKKLKKSQDSLERLSVFQFKMDREIGEIFLTLQAFSELGNVSKKEDPGLIFPFPVDDDDLLN